MTADGLSAQSCDAVHPCDVEGDHTSGDAPTLAPAFAYLYCARAFPAAPADAEVFLNDALDKTPAQFDRPVGALGVASA